MLAVTLVCGLAAFTLWHAIARKQPPGIRQAYAALPDPIRGFVGCPWCAGFWLAAVCVVASYYPGPIDAPWPILALQILAAGAVPGTLDAFTPDDGELT